MSKLTTKLRELERWGSASPSHTWMLIGGILGGMLLVVAIGITIAAIYLLPPGWTNQ